jgi:hypothetical protein
MHLPLARKKYDRNWRLFEIFIYLNFSAKNLTVRHNCQLKISQKFYAVKRYGYLIDVTPGR